MKISVDREIKTTIYRNEDLRLEKENLIYMYIVPDKELCLRGVNSSLFLCLITKVRCSGD